MSSRGPWADRAVPGRSKARERNKVTRYDYQIERADRTVWLVGKISDELWVGSALPVSERELQELLAAPDRWTFEAFLNKYRTAKLGS